MEKEGRGRIKGYSQVSNVAGPTPLERQPWPPVFMHSQKASTLFL